MRRAAGTDAARQRIGVFEVDEEAALTELEQAWAAGGCYGFGADGDMWSVISTAGDVLTGDTPDALAARIRAHWKATQ